MTRAKQTLMKHQRYKNPLGLAFGSALRAERKALNMSMESFAEQLGIKASFYKLVENGTNYLHVNKAPSIVLALEGIMCLNSVSTILLAISHSEAATRSAEELPDESPYDRYLRGFENSIRQLAQMDPNKLGRLLLPYQQRETLVLLTSSPAKEAKAVLNQHGLTYELLEFLRNYDGFGELETGLKSNALVAKLESVPSMYLDLLSDMAGRLSNLPARLGFEEMWRWERENTHLFEELWCIMNNIENTVSEINLSRCHYNHLWESRFKKARILFAENRDEAVLNSDFHNIIKSLLERSERGDCPPEKRMANASTKLKHFDSAMAKIHLRSMPTKPSPQMKIIQDELLIEPYSAFWAFRLVDGTLVGFFAKITDRNYPVRNMLAEGVSLDHKETARKLDLLMRLWEMSRNG